MGMNEVPMTPGRQFVAEMTRKPGRQGRLAVCGYTACSCGCGLPARVAVQVGEVGVRLEDPVAIDALIDVLAENREKLWGPRP